MDVGNEHRLLHDEPEPAVARLCHRDERLHEYAVAEIGFDQSAMFLRRQMVSGMKTKMLLISFAALLLNGCAAYDGLIGHPLHVLHQQHETNEQAKEAKALGEAMFKDTHPK